MTLIPQEKSVLPTEVCRCSARQQSVHSVDASGAACCLATATKHSKLEEGRRFCHAICAQVLGGAVARARLQTGVAAVQMFSPLLGVFKTDQLHFPDAQEVPLVC